MTSLVAGCRLPNPQDLRARRLAFHKPAAGASWQDVTSQIAVSQVSAAPWAFRRAFGRSVAPQPFHACMRIM